MFVFVFSVTYFIDFYSIWYWWIPIFNGQIMLSSTLNYKQEYKFEIVSLFLGIFISQNHSHKNYSLESLGTNAIYNEILWKNCLFVVRFLWNLSLISAMRILSDVFFSLFLALFASLKFCPQLWVARQFSSEFFPSCWGLYMGSRISISLSTRMERMLLISSLDFSMAYT